jgi:hypothetical protein
VSVANSTLLCVRDTFPTSYLPLYATNKPISLCILRQLSKIYSCPVQRSAVLNRNVLHPFHRLRLSTGMNVSPVLRMLSAWQGGVKHESMQFDSGHP